jgi:hypothetical protein
MADELDPGRAFFGPSIDFSRVRIRDSNAVRGGPRVAWTCNNVIRFKAPRAGEPERGHDPDTLIHELGHVWEHQNGQVQLLKGAVEQLWKLLTLGRYDPYDYGGPEGLARIQHLTSLSHEAQAQIIQECWRFQHSYRADRKKVSFTPDYGADLCRLVRDAGIGTVPVRRGFMPLRTLDSWAAWIVNAFVRPFDRIPPEQTP